MNHSPQQTFHHPPGMPFVEIRTTLNSRLPYAAHFHSCFSLGIILAGETRFTLGEAHHVAVRGDLVLIAPGQIHNCNPVGGCARSYHMLHIDMDWLLPLLGGDRPPLLLTRHVVREPDMFDAARALVERMRAATMVEGADSAALAGLLRTLGDRHACFAAEGAGVPGVPLLCAPPPELTHSTGEDAPPSIHALAAQSGIRRESFSRKMRRQTGLAPSSYLHCLRLEKARALLRHGASIAEAAQRVGYVDQSHFHRMFTKYYSVTPGGYQRSGSHSYKK